MARVALVTGETRGIGSEICRALKVAGRTVVATYVGNDKAAEAFLNETARRNEKRMKTVVISGSIASNNM